MTCYPKGIAHGICRSTNGTLAKWRELVDSGYEIKWRHNNHPDTISVEIMYIVNDGFKLIGVNQRGQLLKALKIKLNGEVGIDENTVNFEVPEEIKNLQPKSSNKTRFLKEIKDQIKLNLKSEKERDE